ncbi:LOW QUALITY PROTEIN: nibrin [Drosophila gunungcola]|uniref:LOW QUALITY PROTEIN: nibrin n=1 Tax=Drosophila gunungcola TaxID=103775 RepID=UPI0022E53D18|nr:LOW QUALITY PROTEIN: nibrin [Drosophila gunungcola]
MFVLTKDDEKFVLLPAKSVYTVGRLGTDLIVSQDLSISRNHVEIHLPKDEGDDSLQVEDLGSRYGTFIFPRRSQKPQKIPARTLTPVPVGIRIRFGGNLSIWQVTRLKLVTAVSALTRPEIKWLAEMLEPLGGTVSPDWTEECTHLTMNEVSVTVKLLHALLENKPIVTFAYWKKLLLSAQKVHVTEGWPQPEDYQPTNMDVTWRPERTRLFAGKTFVFMNRKHFEMYGSVVQKAGASCKDLNSGVRKTFLTKSDVIVIQYVPSSQSQATESINSIQDILEQGGRRVIQDYEIGMALLHCSIKEFCNPTHKFINESLPITESVTSSMAFNSSIIVPNTERNTAQSIGSAISELVVPESDAVELEQQSSQADSEPKTSGRSLRKRSHAIILDSDEEQEATSSKRAKPVVQEKPKKIAKNAILVDSSDEEENVQPPAPVPAAKKYAPKRGKPIYCADSSDEENTASKKQPESTVPVADSSPVVTKKPEAPVVSRTSPRLSSKSVATNITNQQPEKQSTGSKRPVLSVALDDEEDVGDLFQFRKSPKKTTERVVQPKSAAKEKPPGRISVINFLEKSQPQEPASMPSQSQTQPRKRLRLEPLNESDSDDCENLFNFADSKKKKKNPENQTHEDSTDGLFNFNSERPSDAVDQDSVLTEPFIPEVETKKKSKYIVVQRKELPKKVDISGWLSCSRLHDDFKSEIKSDPEVSLENSIKTDPDEEKWLSAMKDSIQVRMCNLNIINRSQDELDASLGDSSVSKYSGRKNFKKFVKTNNPHPQRRIVALKSLQLADGMVTCL